MPTDSLELQEPSRIFWQIKRPYHLPRRHNGQAHSTANSSNNVSRSIEPSLAFAYDPFWQFGPLE
jgi:hypothetical protein